MSELYLTIAPRGTRGFTWSQQTVRAHHYLRALVDPRCRPFAYVVNLGLEPVGCLIFGRPEATCCFAGALTYGSLEQVAAGRARFDRWEVINLARVWLDQRVQAGGVLHADPAIPGFRDRKGRWRSTLASWAIRTALGRVGYDYLMHHPPCFVEEPYQLRACLSYCDTRLHRGTIYRAAGFSLARRNREGIETWWTADLAPPTADQDAAIRLESERSARSIRLREVRFGVR